MLRTLILYSLLSVFIGIEAQQTDNVILSFQTGNAKELSKYFDDMISLTLPENELIYSNVQAEVLMKNFFSTYSVNDFKVIHSGDAAGGSIYQIGELTTSKGVFRTYVYGKETEGNILIQEIRIEEN